jgi:hypothetical protein
MSRLCYEFVLFVIHIQFYFTYIHLMNVALQFSKTSTVVVKFYSSILFTFFSLYRLTTDTRPVNL